MMADCKTAAFSCNTRGLDCSLLLHGAKSTTLHKKKRQSKLVDERGQIIIGKLIRPLRHLSDDELLPDRL